MPAFFVGGEGGSTLLTGDQGAAEGGSCWDAGTIPRGVCCRPLLVLTWQACTVPARLAAGVSIVTHPDPPTQGLGPHGSGAQTAGTAGVAAGQQHLALAPAAFLGSV